MKKYFYLIFMIIFFTGCSPIGVVRGFIGIRIDHLNRYEHRYSSTYNINDEKAYNRLLLYFKDDEYVFVYSKKYNKAIYARGFDNLFSPSIDTTDVGFFFTKVNDDAVRIEVVSFNHELAQFLDMEIIKTIVLDKIESSE